MPKNAIASIGPSEDQIAARPVPAPEHTTLAATNTEPVRTKGQPAPVHEVRQTEGKGDNALDQFLHSSLARTVAGRNRGSLFCLGDPSRVIVGNSIRLASEVELGDALG